MAVFFNLTNFEWHVRRDGTPLPIILAKSMDLAQDNVKYFFIHFRADLPQSSKSFINAGKWETTSYWKKSQHELKYTKRHLNP